MTCSVLWAWFIMFDIGREIHMSLDHVFVRTCCLNDFVFLICIIVIFHCYYINTNIWQAYRSATTEWEKSINITKRDKISYRKSSKASSSSNNYTQHSPSHTRNKRKRTDQSNSQGAHNRSSTAEIRPYFKKDSLISQNQHIRWTSSNFLHSGSWKSHRDTILFSDNIDLFSFLTYVNIHHLLPRT
jgi:hypothetical protein